MFTLNELVFTLGGLYVCVNFGENPSRNASVRVHADGQRQTGFIICRVLYAIAVAMGQITKVNESFDVEHCSTITFYNVEWQMVSDIYIMTHKRV